MEFVERKHGHPNQWCKYNEDCRDQSDKEYQFNNLPSH